MSFHFCNFKVQVGMLYGMGSEKAHDRLVKQGQKYFGNHFLCLATGWISLSYLV